MRTSMRALVVVLLGLLAARGGWAAAGEDGALVVIPRAAKAPRLDGQLDDPCWKRAAVLKRFTRPKSSARPKKDVEARLCFDDKNLYVGVRCTEPNPGHIRAEAKRRGQAVWQDDCVELWLRAGSNALDFDQFIANTLGTQQDPRRRGGVSVKRESPKWTVAVHKGTEAWSVEFKIPAGDLDRERFRRGDLLGLKLGREDHASRPSELATWPPGSPYAGFEGYGRAYLEESNCVIHPDLRERKRWGFHKGDEKRFESVEDEGHRAIKISAPGRYSTCEQGLKLRPNALYRLSAEVKASGPMYIRVRARQADQKKDKAGKPFDLRIKKSAGYRSHATRFQTGPDASGLLIVGVTEASGTGRFFVRKLRVERAIGTEATGPAIALQAGAEPLVVTKLRVSDCRAVRGFIGAPVDGTIKSGRWDGANWEYNQPGAGAGVGYAYRKNDGLHITFVGKEGFNAVVVRGGVKAKLYRDVKQYDDSKSGTLLYEFPGQTKNSRAFFAEPVKTDQVSFFEVTDGLIADCSFFRVTKGLGVRKAPARGGDVTFRSAVPDAAIQKRLAQRFPAGSRKAYGFSVPSRAAPGGEKLKLGVKAKQAIHFFSEALPSETGLVALGLDFTIESGGAKIPFTVRVQDPLNPRLELHGADYVFDKPGRVRLVLDFPDQVVPKGAQLWITLRFERPVTLSAPRVELYPVPREAAAKEALAYRKFLLKNFYAVMSEARPWNGFWRPEDIDRFFTDPHRKNYRPWVREIMETIAQCRALDKEGKDDVLRQYYQWFYRHILEKGRGTAQWGGTKSMPPYPVRYDKIKGVPEWAALAHQAWMQAREVARWWIKNRMTPNGEFGGVVGDDTDLMQNFASFPMFERDGVGGMVLDAGRRLAEQAERANLEKGLNKRTMDPLHAYEEGMNQEALMLWWFYGDPVYTNRCIVAAKSAKALTVMTGKGHRHFKSQLCGAADLRFQRKTDRDAHAHPLLWHPAFEVAWYNRNPNVLKMLREWGDGWLEHQQPGRYATGVEVATEKVTASRPYPFHGGYGGQASAQMFLSQITGDKKYVRPFNEYLAGAGGRTRGYVRRSVSEMMQMGFLDIPAAAREKLIAEGRKLAAAGKNWSIEFTATGNKKPLIEALKKDIEELQRFRYLYTGVECFTDRVFLYALYNPSIAYTGGYAARNKYNQTHAVSWEGFGTAYAALVLSVKKDRLKVLLCNLSDHALQGRARVWRLEHGEYELFFGPDADGDDAPDKITRRETVKLARARTFPIELPRKGVYVLELKQRLKLDDILQRPDLALSKLDTRVQKGTVRGYVHNIGAKAAERAVVALLDPRGKIVKQKKLGRLAAPLDLVPKSLPFKFSGLPKALKGWSLVVDPGQQVLEIYEGNNRVVLE